MWEILSEKAVRDHHPATRPGFFLYSAAMSRQAELHPVFWVFWYRLLLVQKLCIFPGIPKFIHTGRQINSVYKSKGERFNEIWKHFFNDVVSSSSFITISIEETVPVSENHNIFPCLHLESSSGILRCRSTNKPPWRKLRLRLVTLLGSMYCASSHIYLRVQKHT